MFEIDSLDIVGKRQRLSASVLRVLLSAVLVFAIFLGPYSFAASLHAQHHDSQSSSSQLVDHENHGHSDTGDHSGVGHALTHCGSTACVPTFVGTPVIPTTFANEIFRKHVWFADGVAMRAQHLEFDPPVPRSGFSLI